MHRRQLRGAAGLLAGCALLIAVAPVLGSTGVSVDLGRIDIQQTLNPGQAYTLPTIGVRNPGTERTTYVMVASPVQDSTLAAPAAGWFVFEPPGLTLDPGQVQRVRVRLVLPPEAAPGNYVVLVGAQIAAAGTGARVGAAAAARTTFTIQPASGLQGFVTMVGRVAGDLMPWTLLVPLLVVALAVLWVVRRRFSFGLRVERRRK